MIESAKNSIAKIEIRPPNTMLAYMMFIPTPIGSKTSIPIIVNIFGSGHLFPVDVTR